MNILDENIPTSQRQLLERWRVRVRQIGFDIGRKSMQDDEIIALLRQRRRSTFFTRDEDFYQRRLCHARYSLVHLAVDKYETAMFVRRLLRHPSCNTQAKRMGTVVWVAAAGLSIWGLRALKERHLPWKRISN